MNFDEETGTWEEAKGLDAKPIDPLAQPFVPRGHGLGKLKMRDYQTEAVDAIYEGWRDHQSLILVMATGLGKTVVAAEVAVRWPERGRILFIAHVRELIYQARDTIGAHICEQPSVEMGDEAEDQDGHPILDKSQVLVASIQTMTRRLRKFNPRDFDVIIIDEFHHGAAATYRKLWDYFCNGDKDIPGNPNIKLLGITATPNRADNLSLKCLAQHTCFELGIREGIDLGWLVPIKQKYIVVDGLDFSACRTVAKDLNEGDLETAMMGGKIEDGMTDSERLDALEKQERMLHAIAAPAVEEAQGKPTLVFCVTVDHAVRMAEILRRYPGISAEIVHGKTHKDERKDIIARFKCGQTQFLVGVGCFLEGFDAPNVQVIVMARPTKSESLYRQQIGRGTRPVPGIVDAHDEVEARQGAIAGSLKPWVTVLDFVGNSGKHKLISTADVLAGDMPDDLVAAAVEEMKETGETEDIRKATWKKKEERDAELRRLAAEKLKQEEERRKKAQAIEEARRARLIAEAEYRAKEIDPFNTHDVAPERSKPTFRGGASDSQVRRARRVGVPEEISMTWTSKQCWAVTDKLEAQTGPDYIVRFGKHMGKRLCEIDHGYLRWAGDTWDNQEFQTNLETYRQQVIEERRQQRKDPNG